MASKAIYRALNRTIDSFDASSFNVSERFDDSSTSFMFDEKEAEAEVPDEFTQEKTESTVYEDKNEELFPKRGRRIIEHFEKEKKFLGTITYIDYSENTFSATLLCTEDDITRNAVFSIDDLSPEYVPLIEIGRKIIYIFGKQYRNGTCSNVSNIYLRRDSKWTKREIELKQNEARELLDVLNGIEENWDD